MHYSANPYFKKLKNFLSYFKLIIKSKIETNLTCVDLNSNHVREEGRTDLRI